MGDVVLSPLLQVLFEKLANPVLQKLGAIWGLKENFKKLRDSLLMVHAILEDAETWQVTDRAVRLWLLKLRDAALDAEDLLDQFESKGALMDSGLCNPKFAIDALEMIKTLELLERTASEGSCLRLRDDVVHGGFDRRESSSFVIESEILGREKDKEKMIELLLQRSQLVGVQVLPIIGIAGVGKTTLAQLAYNDERVMDHFDIKVWVYVSPEFRAVKILKTIIESAINEKIHLSQLGALQSRLWLTIQKNRYLLVLDDVWNEDPDEWDKLRSILGRGKDGSQIILTTRSKKTASIMGTTSPYFLTGLDDDSCWALFKKRAFGLGEEEEYKSLWPIGKQIIKKCEGIPLAAKTLGSLMRFKRGEREWLFVQNSKLWDLDVGETGILPALKLSYMHLPSHLKHCFAFCSVFPKNYAIRKEKLIQLWMAQGLVLPHRGRLLEDIGDEYFNELLWMSFFEVGKNDVDGGIIEYKMHDLIYDLARSISRNESLVLGDAPPTDLEKTRHASLTYEFRVHRILDELHEAIHLRTLLLLTPFFGTRLPQLLKFPYLRVLDLSANSVQLPESIDGLVCLRYLDLSYTSSHTIPAAIGNLHFLQTLNLSGCRNLRELPKLRYTTGLRHLNTFGCESLRSIPEQLGTFVHLQTLPIYIVERSFGRSVSELRNLNLRGALTIKQLENIRSEEEANLANLMEKEHLESLGLCWGNVDPFSVLESSTAYPQLAVTSKDNRIDKPPHLMEFDADLGRKVLGGLKPHQNLNRLYIGEYPGISLPNWLLPNLTEIVLMNCRNCIPLPTLGHLPLLKTLHLQGMHAVISIGPDFYGDNLERNFPSLIELVLVDFPRLHLWLRIAGREAFSRLRKLVVKNCPKLVSMPALSSLRYLLLHYCNRALLGSLNSLTSLSTLELNNFPELLSLPGELLRKNYCLTSLNISSCSKLSSLPSELGHLTVLKSLTIRSCKGLSSLPQGLQNLTALVYLEIDCCNSLISLPEVGVGGLNSLRTMSIGNCQNLASLPLGLENLTSLEHLTIMLCPILTSLPDSLKHLSALRNLSIFGLDQLEALPEGLQHVTALQSLELHSCPCLVSLPEWLGNYSSLTSLVISDCCSLKALPERFHYLASLQQLTIQGCPDLQDQCKPYKGKDWSKIAHIPYRHIASSYLSESKRVGSSSR